MERWIVIGILIYFIIGFIYSLAKLYIIISEDENDPQQEFNSKSIRVLFLFICTIFWSIIILLTIIYRLYDKLKGGNKNE